MRGNVFYQVPPYCSKLYCLNIYMAMYSDERGKEAVLFYRYEDSTMTEKCFFLCLFLRLLYIREHRQLGLLLKACNYWHLKFTLQLPPRNRPISSAFPWPFLLISRAPNPTCSHTGPKTIMDPLPPLLYTTIKAWSSHSLNTSGAQLHYSFPELTSSWRPEPFLPWRSCDRGAAGAPHARGCCNLELR